MDAERTFRFLAVAVIVMAAALFRPNSGKRVILFVILLAFGVLAAIDLTMKFVLLQFSS